MTLPSPSLGRPLPTLDAQHSVSPRASFLLPMCPTKNGLYLKGRIRTQIYRNWLNQAGIAILTSQLKIGGRSQVIRGPIAIHMEVERNERRDLQNHLTPVCDLLQYANVIENDRQIQTIHMDWSDDIRGIKVEVWPMVAK